MKMLADNLAYRINDHEKILLRMEEVHLTLLGAKSIVGAKEILIVGHMWG